MSLRTGPSRHGPRAISFIPGLVGLGCFLWLGVAAAHEVGLSRGVYTVHAGEVAAELTFARAELRLTTAGVGGAPGGHYGRP